MNTRELRERLRDADWASPSAELRARILAQATVTRAAITWSDRIWFSRTWRGGALATTVMLIGIASWADPGASLPASSTINTSEVAVAEEAARDAGFEPEQAVAFSRRDSVAVRARATPPDLNIAGSLFEGGDR